jgi:hypothetical protein
MQWKMSKTKKSKSMNTPKMNMKITYVVVFVGVFIIGLVSGLVVVRVFSGELKNEKKVEEVLGQTAEEPIVEKLLPESFPKDFPVLENAVLVDTWTTDSQYARGLSVVWETNMSVGEATELLQGRLKNNGWTSEIVHKQEAETITFEKDGVFGEEVCIRGESCEVAGFVNVKVEEGITTISVTMGIKTY